MSMLVVPPWQWSAHPSLASDTHRALHSQQLAHVRGREGRVQAMVPDDGGGNVARDDLVPNAVVKDRHVLPVLVHRLRCNADTVDASQRESAGYDGVAKVCKDLVDEVGLGGDDEPSADKTSLRSDRTVLIGNGHVVRLLRSSLARAELLLIKAGDTRVLLDLNADRLDVRVSCLDVREGKRHLSIALRLELLVPLGNPDLHRRLGGRIGGEESGKAGLGE